MRKIDLFTHVFPPRYYERFMKVAGTFKDIGKRMRGVPMLWDLDTRFRVMDAFDDYVQVLSLPTPPIEVFARGTDALDLAKAANDGMAELVQHYPDRFLGFVAALPLADPDAAARELDRALDELGAKGFQILSNICGKPITNPEFLPLFEAVVRRDRPIWMHPYRGADFSDYQAENRSQYEIWWTLGWPYDTSVAMARVVFEGYFDRFPTLKIITHHMGGMAPYFEGRIGPGWDQLGTRTSDTDYSAVLKSLKKRPLDYFKMFYADTALFGAFDATVCGLKFFGVDKVVFASDAPFDPERGPMYIRETIGVVDRLPISDAERQRIYSGNALALLRVPTSGRDRG